MKAFKGSRDYHSGTRWRWAVNFSSGRFTPGKEPRYALKRRLGGPQSLSGRFLGCHMCSAGKMQSFNIKVNGTYCYHLALTFKETFCYFRLVSQDLGII